MAKKNGKSTLYAAVALVLLLGDAEGAPEIYLLACDREQASMILEESKRMVTASPELSCRLEVIKDRIIDPKGYGKIQTCRADVPSKDGVNAHGMLFDELHRQKTRDLWDIFEYAGASREQPLTLSITTAGEDESGVWHEQREYSEQVNAGVIPDTTHLGVVYRALEEDDLDDPQSCARPIQASESRSTKRTSPVNGTKPNGSRPSGRTFSGFGSTSSRGPTSISSTWRTGTGATPHRNSTMAPPVRWRRPLREPGSHRGNLYRRR